VNHCRPADCRDARADPHVLAQGARPTALRKLIDRLKANTSGFAPMFERAAAGDLGPLRNEIKRVARQPIGVGPTRTSGSSTRPGLVKMLTPREVADICGDAPGGIDIAVESWYRDSRSPIRYLTARRMRDTRGAGGAGRVGAPEHTGFCSDLAATRSVFCRRNAPGLAQAAIGFGDSVRNGSARAGVGAAATYSNRTNADTILIALRERVVRRSSSTT